MPWSKTDKSPAFRKREGHRLRTYGIVRRNTAGKIEGFIDASICSMGWSADSIYVWYEPPTHYCKGDEGDGRFIVRLNSKVCPIKITGQPSPRRRRNTVFVQA